MVLLATLGSQGFQHKCMLLFSSNNWGCCEVAFKLSGNV